MRNNKSVFSGEISISRMKRKHTELTSYLFREMSFPKGVYLMTGTGIVPPDTFTLNIRRYEVKYFELKGSARWLTKWPNASTTD